MAVHGASKTLSNSESLPASTLTGKRKHSDNDQQDFLVKEIKEEPISLL